MDSRPDHRFDSRSAGITVQRALELPGLRGGLPEVVAGGERLDRTVRWVHAGEVPNIASLLKGGELLLTTGSVSAPARPSSGRSSAAWPSAASPPWWWSWDRASSGCRRLWWRRRARPGSPSSSCTARWRS